MQGGGHSRAQGVLSAAGDAAAQRQLSQYLRSGSLACPPDKRSF